jgi:hypothetical protein
MGMMMTPDGGLAVQLVNKTGAIAVKGSLVSMHTTIDSAVQLAAADSAVVCGVIGDYGAVDGDPVWVVIAGNADVLLQDSTLAIRSGWARVSATVSGRADITNAAPPNGSIANADIHFKGIGCSQQSVSAGTNKLCRVLLNL